MSEDSILTIDIDRILREKAGTKYRYIPKFLINYLRRIVHEEELNAFIFNSRHLKGVEYLQACMQFLDVTLHIKGKEYLPAEDAAPCIFVSNHPLGGIDGVAIGAALGEHYHGRIRYMVNDLLMNVAGLAPLCIPINKTGAQSRNLPEQIAQGLAEPNHLIMFPAGICSRRHKGIVSDLPWGKQFIVQSVKTQRDVVPLHFSGCNSDFFYRLANLREALGLKFNIEMIYLADEMMKNRHKEFTLTVGKPIPWQTFDQSKRPLEWSRYVREISYKL